MLSISHGVNDMDGTVIVYPVVLLHIILFFLEKHIDKRYSRFALTAACRGLLAALDFVAVHRLYDRREERTYVLESPLLDGVQTILLS